MEESYWQALLQQHTQALLHISFLYVKDWHAAEDIVQDVFVKFFEKQELFRHEASIATYLTRMTINRSKDYLKSFRYRTQQLTNYFTQSISTPNTLLVKEEQLAIADAILALPLKYREPIILYFYQNKTFHDISLLLQLPESTVHYRFTQAKKKLQQQITATEWELFNYESNS
ncbi:sigma-70 family RNA polymerase sigma factor [Kurthia huakuii]|uniref:sigma-70 family RNA polymerase sigma factor n=1 Tax=Kurthia huakuii TaxID=1421019 RepID=UPI000496E158|nr:sigma-70 family RNA polymerase sigma factor [Kurthia huakuii]